MTTPISPRRMKLTERVQNDKNSITVEEVDAVLKDLSKGNSPDLINFWLDVRLDIAGTERGNT